MANLRALAPNTFGELMQFCEMLAKSTMIPVSYQKNPANIVLAVQTGAELGLPALQALNAIAVINGIPGVYGDTQLALVLASQLCEDVIEHFEGEGDTRTAFCEARRKGRAPITKTFSVEDAKRARLWGKAGPWTQYPDRMLQMRARGFALRDGFPDVLKGIISVEEARDIPREPPKDVTPPQTAAAELDAFAAGTETDPPKDAFVRLRHPDDEVRLRELLTRPQTAAAEPSSDQCDDTRVDMAPDEAEVDSLLTDAHNFAQQGDTVFRRWYFEVIDGNQRGILSPHLRELGATARAADNARRAQPSQGETDMGLAGDKDVPSEAPATDSSIRLILPARGPKGGVNWTHYADEVIEEARAHDPMHMHEFRVRYAAPLNSLRLGNKEEWERLTKTLAALERGEDTEDERNLKDDATTMT